MEILPQLLINALISGSIYALASSGLAIVYGLLRILNFAHGHLMMMGAYLFYLFHVQQEQNLALSAVLTIAATVVISILAMRVFVMPFLRLSFFLVFVTTLALSTMLESVVSMIFGVNVKSLSIGYQTQSYEIYGIYITPIQIIIIASAIVLLSLLGFVIHCTSFGRKVRALSEYKYAAQSLGISSNRTNYIIFVVGTLLES